MLIVLTCLIRPFLVLELGACSFDCSFKSMHVPGLNIFGPGQQCSAGSEVAWQDSGMVAAGTLPLKREPYWGLFSYQIE